MSALYAVEQLLDMLDKSGSAYLQTASILARLARGEFAALHARIAELEADALARLIEEPTNERIMKDVYEENERLQKAVDEAEIIMRGMYETEAVKQWLKEYGGKE